MGLTIGVNLDMQQYYDNLILIRKSIDAQIEVLEVDPSICTHQRIVDGPDGIKLCANNGCGKIIDSGTHDWVR